MRTAFLILALSALSAFGQAFSFNDHEAWLAQQKKSTGGSPCGGILCENFEDASIGYDNNNANGWLTNSGTAINPKYTTTILEGTQSLMVDESGATAPSLELPFTPLSSCWFTWMIRIHGTYTGTGWVLRLCDNTGTTILLLKVSGGNALSWNTFGTTTPITYDTTYYMWVNYAAGTGANGVCTVYLSTTTSRGSAIANLSTTGGTWTANVGQLRIGTDSGDSVLNIIMDHIRLYSSDPGATFPP